MAPLVGLEPTTCGLTERMLLYCIIFSLVKYCLFTMFCVQNLNISLYVILHKNATCVPELSHFLIHSRISSFQTWRKQEGQAPLFVVLSLLTLYHGDSLFSRNHLPILHCLSDHHAQGHKGHEPLEPAPRSAGDGIHDSLDVGHAWASCSAP